MSELIDSHAQHLRAAGKSPHTINSRIRMLRVLHDFLPFGLAYASTEELEDFLQSDPTWGDWTRSTYATHVRGFYRWAAKRSDMINADPSVDMARPRKPESVPNPVTGEQLATALRRSPEPWFTVITLAAFAGLRVSEAVGVQREDVTEWSIRIRRAKGGNAAVIDTHPVVWQLVRERPPGALAFTPRGKPVSTKWVCSGERNHFDSIGLPEVVIHRFRHWFATALLEGGADLRTVQEAMRHRSITSTQGYTKVRGEVRRRAIQALPTPEALQ